MFSNAVFFAYGDFLTVAFKLCILLLIALQFAGYAYSFGYWTVPAVLVMI